MPLVLFFASLRSSFIIEQASKGNKGRRNQSFFSEWKSLLILFKVSFQKFIQIFDAFSQRVLFLSIYFRMKKENFFSFLCFLFILFMDKEFFSKYYLWREQRKFLRECHKSYLMWHFNLRLNDFEKNIIIFGGFIYKRSDEGRQDA